MAFSQYLVSMLRDNVSWVQNVRAAGGEGLYSEAAAARRFNWKRFPLMSAHLS